MLSITPPTMAWAPWVPPVHSAPRRLVLLGALTALSAPARAHADEDDAATLEDRLASALEEGGPAGIWLSTSGASVAESLVASLEKLGGSQRALAEGIGGFEVPWIGPWDIVYAGGAGAFPTEIRDGAQGQALALKSARQFVYGPADAKAELSGRGVDGSASVELVYGDTRLVAISGSLTKLPSYAYRLDLSQPAAAYSLRRGSRDITPLPSTRTYSVAGAGGATMRRISYLSERLWISRSDNGDLTVLQRCDAIALAPPATRPDLTAPCSDTADRPVCRRQALF